MKKKIMIADDSKFNRDMLTEILGDKYRYVYADNGVQLIDCLSNGADIDIILLDINMPLMDGFRVLEIMNERHWIEEIPVVIISEESDTGFLQKAYSMGVTDYIPRPFLAVTVQFRVKNTLMLYSQQRQLVQLVEEQVYEREEINNAMINIFSHTIELRNNESGLHTLSVRKLSNILLHRIAEVTDKYDLNENDIAVISALSALHDIGKISIPKSILNKPGKLTDEEWKIMKAHTEIGDEIIATVQIPQSAFVIKIAREICRWHHERWDGKGYPDGLEKDDIPISAQVVSIADVYDALTSDRCYKKAFTHEQAIDMICNGECGAFNPLLIQCLIDVAPILKELSGQVLKKFDYKNEAKILTLETLKSHDLPINDRSSRLLSNEKEKKEFFKSLIGGIQFEYDCPSRKVTFTNWYDDANQRELFIHDDDNMDLLSQKDWNTLVGRLRKTDREHADVSMTVLIPINGEFRWYRLTARTIWPERGNEYIGVMGQFIDVNDEIIKSGVGVLLRDEATAGTIIDFLKHIFGIVRLVNPKDYSVLDVSEDGELVSLPTKCYELWNRKGCCEFCSSHEAFECKGMTSKLEAKGTELYSVISKYIKIGERECVLELAFSMSESSDGSKLQHLPERTRLLLLNVYKDSLTEAYSRMYLEDFKSNLENADAVALIDIDGFKNINDTYGHPVGDMALKHIAKIIKTSIDDKGISIRYGGDEFLLVFQKIAEPQFFDLLKQIKENVSKSTLEKCPEIDLNISIGGAYHAASLTEAITKADKEMYKNKPKKSL